MGAHVISLPARRYEFPTMAVEPTQKEWTGEPIRVGVIGGSGLYKLSNIEVVDHVNPLTVRLS